MNSSTKAFSFTKILRVACATIEILCVIGLFVMFIFVPFAESRVSNGSHLTISKSATTGGFTYVLRPSRHRDIVVTNEASGQTGSAGGDTGSVSIGPFSLKADKAGQFFKAVTLGKDVEVQQVEGMVTLTGPARATEALRLFKWPAITGEFCAILLGIAFFEILRRLLGSSERGELFTDANVRMLRQFAFLMIAIDLIKFAASAVLVTRMNAYVTPFFSDGTWMLPTTMPGKLNGVFSGVTILLLAEVFREGLKFKKDSDLTI